MAKILFCTVGGSFQPIVNAIRAHQADRVVFICSEDDPTAGSRGKGSYVEVIGEGMVCHSKFPEPPDLPNIPTQVGLGEGQFEVVLVPADDPEAIVVAMRERLLKAVKSGDEVIADYTGGTKSMSGGLMMAAIHTDGVKLSLIGGVRTNRVKVGDGMQAMRRVNVAKVRALMRLDEVKSAWKRHAYAEAAELLHHTGSDDPDVQRALILSRAYSAWDRFDHQTAYYLLESMSAHVSGRLLGAIGTLKYDEVGEVEAIELEIQQSGQDPRKAYDAKRPNLQKTRAFKLWDLYLNAERRALSGQYDAAVLLLYRVFEGIAQSALFFDYHIKSHDAPAEIAIEYPEYVNTGRDGNYVIGNHNAWSLLARLGDGPLNQVGAATSKSRRDFLERRNRSLFAHGFRPIDRPEFEKSRAFFDEAVKPAFLETYFKGRIPFDQLPTEF